jgi:hypothetical protein
MKTRKQACPPVGPKRDVKDLLASLEGATAFHEKSSQQMKGKYQMSDKRCSTCSIRSRRSALIAVSLYPLLWILALFTICSRTEAITYQLRGVIDEFADSNFDFFDDSLGIGSSYAASLSIWPGVSPYGGGYYPGGGYAPEFGVLENDIRYRVLLGGVQELESDGGGDDFVKIENNGLDNFPFSALFGDRFLFTGERTGGPVFLNFVLTDPSGTALQNNSLPTSLDIADWATAQWSLVFLGQFENSRASGRITSIAVVPETSGTSGLLTIGLLAVAAIGRGSETSVSRIR